MIYKEPKKVMHLKKPFYMQNNTVPEYENNRETRSSPLFFGPNL